MLLFKMKLSFACAVLIYSSIDYERQSTQNYNFLEHITGSTMVFLEKTKKDGRIKCCGCKQKFEERGYWLSNSLSSAARGKRKWHIKCYGKFTGREQRLRYFAFPDVCYPPEDPNLKNKSRWNEDHANDPDIHKTCLSTPIVLLCCNPREFCIFIFCNTCHS